MNLNFCVKWLRQIASGANDVSIFGLHRASDLGSEARQSISRDESDKHHRAADFRSHSRLLSEFRRGYDIQASIDQMLAPFFTTGSVYKSKSRG